MKCQHCNQEIQEDANFCTNCGKPTTSQGALPPVIQQPENQQIQKTLLLLKPKS
ncbi:MAG: zinc-ribbon domain-containing protein [Candidatus Avelusimicrobium sp.]|uniref:zinc-ribbon domain-containing protein n=1 Tax=Candidatus Avelusimicrobium sp. TaxID=3048833 RepID=UPI003F125742